MGRAFANFSITCSVVAKPMKNPLVESIILKKRIRAGLKIIYQRDALRAITKALKRNEFVGILIDQDAGEEGIFPDFFGRPASTVPTVAALAAKFNCSILPCVLFMEGRNKYSFYINGPLKTVLTGNRQEDLLNNTQLYNNIIEAQVRRHPDQYFGWLHRRWKTKDR
jgi:KDO2-lipid IV(A) lauroyltransferase